MLSSAAFVHYFVYLSRLKGSAEPVLIRRNDHTDGENKSSLLWPTFTFLFRRRHVTTVVIITRKRGGMNGGKSGGGPGWMVTLNKLKTFIQETAVWNQRFTLLLWQRRCVCIGSYRRKVVILSTTTMFSWTWPNRFHASGPVQRSWWSTVVYIRGCDGTCDTLWVAHQWTVVFIRFEDFSFRPTGIKYQCILSHCSIWFPDNFLQMAKNAQKKNLDFKTTLCEKYIFCEILSDRTPL